MCQKSSRFPSPSSWRRRNFLGKHFHIPGICGGAAAKARQLCSVLFLCCCRYNSVLEGGGQEAGSGRSASQLLLKRQSFTKNSRASAVGFLPEGRRNVCSPLSGPHLRWKDGRWCGWILEISAGQQLQLPDPTNKMKKRCSDTGFCRNKHLGDNASQPAFLSDSRSSLLSPPLSFRDFLNWLSQQQHRGHYFWNTNRRSWDEPKIRHKPFENDKSLKTFVIKRKVTNFYVVGLCPGASELSSGGVNISYIYDGATFFGNDAY